MLYLLGSRYSVFGMMTRSGTPGLGFEFREEREIIFSLNRPECLWGPHILLFNGYGVLSRRWRGRVMQLTAHRHLLPRLRMPLNMLHSPHRLLWWAQERLYRFLAFITILVQNDQPRGLVVRAYDYWSRGPGFDSRLYHGNFPCGGRIPVVTMDWVVSRFGLKVETSSTRSQKSINSDWTHERSPRWRGPHHVRESTS